MASDLIGVQSMTSSVKNILVVDPEPSVLRFTATVLRRLGHRVWEAEDSRQALKMCGAGTFDLLVCDVNSEPGGGLELAMGARMLHPGLRVLYIAGYAGPAHRVWEEVRSGRAGFLPKPFLPGQITTMIAALLAY
jgi:DNA-binding NtrC family response regulator